MEAPETSDVREPGHFYRARPLGGPAIFRFERLDGPQYKVLEPFEYVDKLGHWYRVPAVDADDRYNETDFASVPFFLTWLVPKDGSHTPAAVLHDAFIGGQVGLHYDTSAAATISDERGDYLFREAMEQSGVAWLRRWFMWGAVALRTLTTRITHDSDGHAKSQPRWGRIALIGLVVAAWVLLSAAMALDVPDLASSKLELPWLGDRSWFSEIGWALAMVGIGTMVMGVFFGAVTWSGRGISAGALAGVAIGFLGLPMLASLIGAAGYFLLERIAGWVVPIVSPDPNP